jgi:hypothetical protein
LSGSDAPLSTRRILAPLKRPAITHQKGRIHQDRATQDDEPTRHPCYGSVMQRNAAMATLKAYEAELKQLGGQHLYLFGSTARGEAGEDSDVELFFYYGNGRLWLFELMDVQERTAAIHGRKADIITRDSLHRILRKRIEATAGQVS